MKAIHIFIALLYVAFASSTFAQLTNRPKVGLVLGGGGALGFAHIGVLRVLEEQRIPIDYIAGTSMGSIIAGLYACGLSPDDMEAFLKGLDWNEVMNDETPRRELFFRQKQDDQRYLFDMGLNWNGPKFNTGMAVGQKFNNLMQLITLRSASVTNFDLLPIPYRAVATDLASGKAFVIRHGNLATAMRASMAVPGVFTPIELDGHLLVDGGVVNNLPVDVVKAMGADIVIAVDVGSDSDTVDPSQLRSLGGILGRTYAIAQRPNSLEQLGKADIKLQPVLAGFTASQFDRVADLIPPGERAARAHLAELAGLGVGEADYAAFLQRQRRGVPPSPRVSEVAVTGCDRVSEAIVRGRIRSEPGALFDPQTMQRDLMRMYGIGEFEQVMFRLEPGADGGSRLAYEVREKNWGPLYLAYGVNLRSDFEYDADWRMLVNVTRRSINALGAEWRNEAELGSGQAVLSEFYQPLEHRGILFVAPTVEYRAEREALYQEGEHVADYNVRQMEMRLDPGVQLRHYAELRAGPVWGTGRATVETGSADLPNVDADYAGWHIRLTVDRQDRTLFAREGYFVELEGMLARESLGSDEGYDKVSGTLTKQSSVGDHTITATVLGGSALGSDLPGYIQFTLGGPFSFAGLAEDQFRGSYLGVASLGYRYRLNQLPAQLGRAVYVLTRFDTGNVWDDDADLDDLRYGGALGIGADTAFGPLYLAYGRADQGYSRVYFSLGTAF